MALGLRVGINKPKTKLGKQSVLFILAMFGLFYIGMNSGFLYSDIPAGPTIMDDILGRPVVSLSMLTGFVCGILAFFKGYKGIKDQKESSIYVYISTLIGGLLMVFLFFEITSPH